MSYMNEHNASLSLVEQLKLFIVDQIDALRVDMNNGFKRVDEQFQKAEERDRALSAKIDRENENMAIIVQNGFKDMAERIDQNSADIKVLQTAVKENTIDIKRLEISVGENTTEIKKINKRIGRVENISSDHEERIRKIE